MEKGDPDAAEGPEGTAGEKVTEVNDDIRRPLAAPAAVELPRWNYAVPHHLADGGEGEEEEKLVVSATGKIQWTSHLKLRFQQAVDCIGVQNLTPKKLVVEMNIPGLTTSHIGSHLQHYRNDLKRKNDSKDGRAETVPIPKRQCKNRRQQDSIFASTPPELIPSWWPAKSGDPRVQVNPGLTTGFCHGIGTSLGWAPPPAPVPTNFPIGLGGDQYRYSGGDDWFFKYPPPPLLPTMCHLPGHFFYDSFQVNEARQRIYDVYDDPQASMFAPPWAGHGHGHFHLQPLASSDIFSFSTAPPESLLQEQQQAKDLHLQPTEKGAEDYLNPATTAASREEFTLEELFGNDYEEELLSELKSDSDAASQMFECFSSTTTIDDIFSFLNEEVIGSETLPGQQLEGVAD